jgi:hypothetical protein
MPWLIRKTYLAPRCPPYNLVLNSMLILDTSLGSISAPGPTLSRSSYFHIYQHMSIVSRGSRGGEGATSGVSEVSAEERIVPAASGR